MENTSIGNGTGRIYVADVKLKRLSFANTTENLARIGGLFCVDPSASFYVYANLAAPLNPMFVPDAAALISLHDLREMVASFLLASRMEVAFTEASATWTVTHNKGVRPLVQLLQPDGTVMLATVQHTSVNSVTATFDDPQTGTMVLIFS